MDWLSNSPDINPIENLWAILKGRVEKEINKLLVKKKPVTTDCFREIIQKEWKRRPLLIWLVACQKDWRK